jgi:hypothetical protein
MGVCSLNRLGQKGPSLGHFDFLSWDRTLRSRSPASNRIKRRGRGESRRIAESLSKQKGSAALCGTRRPQRLILLQFSPKPANGLILVIGGRNSTTIFGHPGKPLNPTVCRCAYLYLSPVRKAPRCSDWQPSAASQTAFGVAGLAGRRAWRRRGGGGNPSVESSVRFVRRLISPTALGKSPFLTQDDASLVR